MTSGAVTPPDYIYPFCYDSPSLLKEAVSADGELYDELSRKGAGSEIIDGFGTFIEKYKSQGVIVPFLNGKEIDLSDKRWVLEHFGVPVGGLRAPVGDFLPVRTYG